MKDSTDEDSKGDPRTQKLAFAITLVEKGVMGNAR